jgi:hypothetical protein
MSGLRPETSHPRPQRLHRQSLVRTEVNHRIPLNLIAVLSGYSLRSTLAIMFYGRLAREVSAMVRDARQMPVPTWCGYCTVLLSRWWQGTVRRIGVCSAHNQPCRLRALPFRACERKCSNTISEPVPCMGTAELHFLLSLACKEHAGMLFLKGASCQALECLIRLGVRSGGLAELWFSRSSIVLRRSSFAFQLSFSSGLSIHTNAC